MRALVTGASRGIGRATAVRLAEAGFDLLLHYRTHAEEARGVAEEVRRRGRSAELLRADLAKPDDVEALAAFALAPAGPLHVLVHNAGEYPRQNFAAATPEAVRELFQVHVLGPLELTRRLQPALARAAPGRVIFVSSVLAFQGARHGAPYASAKAALLGLSRSLARELAPEILTNVVAPGSIDTAILAGDTPEQRLERERGIPLGRIGRPEEVADAIAFLASPAANYITGTTLHVNGGIRIG